MAGRPASEKPTDTEMLMLHILWEQGEQSVDQLRDYFLSQGTKRSESGIRTILKAMIGKGQLSTTVRDRVTYYSPAISQYEAEEQFFSHMIRRVFEGDREAFILRAFDASDISLSEIERLLKEARAKATRS